MLLAAYFIPTWAIIACRIMVSPVHGLFERPSVSVALFISDHLQLASLTMVRLAWLLALGRLTVVGFFAIFVFFAARALIRKTGGGAEALAIALAIGSVISFASMMLASRVGEMEAVRLHATELLMMLGTAVVMLFEGRAQPQAVSIDASQHLSIERSELPSHR